MNRRTVTQLKKLFREKVKVVPGGPADKTRGLGMLAVLDALAENSVAATNDVVGGPKSALYLTRADAEAAGQPGDLSLEDIADSLIVIGNLAYVDLPAAGQARHYVARYYGGPDPTRFCFMDGDGVARPDHFQQYNGLAPYAWFPVESAAAGVPAYDSLPAGYPFKAGELTRAYVPGVTTEQFFKARTNGPLPAPSQAGGDDNWEAVDEQDVPTGSVSAFGQLQGDPYDNAALAAAFAALRLKATPRTYAECVTDAAFGKLDPGNPVLLNYQHAQLLPGTNEMYYGAVEPLVLIASSRFGFSPVAYSQTYPQDIIYYQLSNTGYLPGCTNGYIFRRIDSNYGNDCEIDFRNVLFPRWYETFPKPDADGRTGGYTSLTDNGGQRILVGMFENYFKCRNNVITGLEKTRLGTDANVSVFDNINFTSDAESRVVNCRFINSKAFGAVQGGTWFRELTLNRSSLSFKAPHYQNVNFFGGTITDSTITGKVVDGDERGFSIEHSTLGNVPFLGKKWLDSQPYGSGGGGGSIATTTYTAPAAGAQSIPQAGATWFGGVSIRTAGGKVIPLDYGTGYTFTAGQLQVLAAAGVATQDVLNYSYATGSVSGPPAAGDNTGPWPAPGAGAVDDMANTFTVPIPLNGNFQNRELAYHLSLDTNPDSEPIPLATTATVNTSAIAYRDGDNVVVRVGNAAKPPGAVGVRVLRGAGRGQSAYSTNAAPFTLTVVSSLLQPVTGPGWYLHKQNAGAATVTAEDNDTVRIEITGGNGNNQVQFWNQEGGKLQNGKQYKLSVWAHADAPTTIACWSQSNVDYADLGLTTYFDLTDTYQKFEVTFTAKHLDGTMNDAIPDFLLGDKAGRTIWLSTLVITQVV